eukprot:GEMP01053522.1.p1 GENE.GEMP01053522.1~~GEMP01053522.1.p1  ORF type:complete len:205 (+),score=50.15 GEMP01053522.1:47-616(+)
MWFFVLALLAQTRFLAPRVESADDTDASITTFVRHEVSAILDDLVLLKKQFEDAVLLQVEHSPKKLIRKKYSGSDKKALSNTLEGIKKRLKKHIASIGQEERREKKLFENMAKQHHSSQVAKVLNGMRQTQHERFRSMLKVAHAGLERVSFALRLFDDLNHGHKPKPEELKQLQNMIPTTVKDLAQYAE